MNVLRIPVRVTTMLIVPTLAVLTAVLVNKDLLEMASFVKVSKSCVVISCLYVDIKNAFS